MMKGLNETVGDSILLCHHDGLKTFLGTFLIILPYVHSQAVFSRVGRVCKGDRGFPRK